MRACLLVLTVAVVLAAGCGSSGSDRSSGPAPSTASASTSEVASSGSSGTTTTGSDATATTFGGSRADQSGPATGTTTALLTSVRVAHHPGFDRVVFEFRGSTPSWTVRYVEGPFTEDPSGRAVPVAGGAFLEVAMRGGSGFDIDTGTATYTGSRSITPSGTATVRQVARTGDFEGQLGWVIGVGSRVAFHASTLSGPPRLVVDVAAP